MIIEQTFAVALFLSALAEQTAATCYMLARGEYDLPDAIAKGIMCTGGEAFQAYAGVFAVAFGTAGTIGAVCFGMWTLVRAVVYTVMSCKIAVEKKRGIYEWKSIPGFLDEEPKWLIRVSMWIAAAEVAYIMGRVIIGSLTNL